MLVAFGWVGKKTLDATFCFFSRHCNSENVNGRALRILGILPTRLSVLFIVINSGNK